jgi:hypothetical protein
MNRSIHHRWSAVACLLVPVIGLAAPAWAQSPDPFDTARHRQGPVAANPELALTNLGVDTNVFNEPTNAKSDFVLGVRPGTDVWVRMGRARIEGHTHVAFNYFSQYDTERSADTYNRARVEVRGQRLTPFAQVGFVSARDRLTPEFDARVRRQEKSLTVGTDVAVGAKTTLRASFDRFDTNFNDSVAAGAFSTSLDHREDSGTVSLRYRLTPLTTLVLLTDRQQNRFDFATERDAIGIRVTPGVEFDAGALIRGTAYLGYRRFDFDDRRVKDFTGLVATVNLSYAPRPTLRLGFTADRNLEYSFDIQQPYYVASGIGGDVTQQFSQRWSGSARAVRRRLNYGGAALRLVSPRNDGVTQLSAGLGYRLGLHARAEALLAYNGRNSELRDREYSGVRLGSSLIYEF